MPYAPMRQTSIRGLLFWGDQRHWEHWGQLPYAVQTGQPAVDALRGEPMFDFLQDDPEFAAIFNDGMTSASDLEIPSVLAAYDFTETGTIVDVGGGHGRLLAAILRKWPRSHGILFDSESVVEGAPAVLDAAGVADRCSLSAARSLNQYCPAGTPICSHTSCTIGMNPMCCRSCVMSAPQCRAAQNYWSSRVSCPTTTANTCPKMLDLEMLVVATGRERTVGARVIPTVGPTSIVEAEAA